VGTVHENSETSESETLHLTCPHVRHHFDFHVYLELEMISHPMCITAGPHFARLSGVCVCVCVYIKFWTLRSQDPLNNENIQKKSDLLYRSLNYIHFFTYPLSLSLSLPHSLNYPLSHWFSYTLIHSVTQLLTHSITHSFTY